jgi:hypothetical protein
VAGTIYSTASHSTGKHYVEVTFGGSDPDFAVGIWDPDTDTGALLDADGSVTTSEGTIAVFDPLDIGDVVGMALDADAGRVWFRVNGGDWNNDPLQAPE